MGIVFFVGVCFCFMCCGFVGSENVLFGLLILVGMVCCFVYGYEECVQVIMAGLIGAYTGNRIGGS